AVRLQVDEQHREPGTDERARLRDHRTAIGADAMRQQYHGRVTTEIDPPAGNGVVGTWNADCLRRKVVAHGYGVIRRCDQLAAQPPGNTDEPRGAGRGQ